MQKQSISAATGELSGFYLSTNNSAKQLCDCDVNLIHGPFILTADNQCLK